MAPKLEGFLNISKPIGCTSRDIVNRVQRFVRPAKVGHAGTLDPLAEGVLVVAIGQGTRLIESVQESQKAYLGVFQLGCTSDSEDTETPIVPLENPPIPDLDSLSQSCARFVGEIDQVPPQYSALKVQGKRAYDMARRGEKAELKARRVRIDACSVAAYDYPEMQLDIRCGSGVYVRSLGRDIGESLGSGAVMIGLTRTAVGPFCIDDALCGNDITADSIERSLLPLTAGVAHLPSCAITEEEKVELSCGRFIAHRFDSDERLLAATSPNGRLAAILKPTDENKLRPVKFFPEPE